MRRTLRLSVSLLAALLLAAGPGPARAEDPELPSFFDPHVRTEAPDLGGSRTVRFLTGADYPPFEVLADGALTGFDVDLARAICGELSLTCSIQAWAWDDIVNAVAEGRADAIIAGLRPTPTLKQRLAFSRRYFALPARFAGRREAAPREVTPEGLGKAKAAVVAGSAHEAYLAGFFPDLERIGVASLAEGFEAVEEGRAELVFGDGVQLAVLFARPEAPACCRLLPGAFMESRFFGEGLAIAVGKDNETLRAAFDHALQRLSDKGVLTELYLRYFPVGVF